MTSPQPTDDTAALISMGTGTQSGPNTKVDRLAAQLPSYLNPRERLFLDFPTRMLLSTSSATLIGFMVGAAHGGTMAGLRFRAENAHRLPATEVGWYFYHKSKNYNAMLGGIKEGMRMGLRIGVMVGLFVLVEESVDRFRGAMVESWAEARLLHHQQQHTRRGDGRGVSAGDGKGGLGAALMDAGLEQVTHATGSTWVQRDFLSTTVAMMASAGAFSAWSRLPLPTTAKIATLALKAGVGYGLFQDAVGHASGNRLGYVEFIKRGFARLASRNSTEQQELGLSTER